MTPLPTLLLALTVVLAGAPALAQGASRQPERLAVTFLDVPADVQPNGRFLGADVLRVDGATAVVQAPDGAAFRARAHGRADLRAVEPDALHHALGLTPNDPLFAKQFAPQMMGAPAAWGTTLGDPAITVCLVDTGVRHTHQDLSARYRGGHDFVNRDTDPMDDGGHGTRTAGAAAASVNNGVGIAGIANASIKSAKVLNAAGSGYSTDIALGIRWCADNGARVITMSFGSATDNTPLKDAVDYAAGKGILLVAGAGNGGCSGCVLYPAAYPSVLAVGSVDQGGAPSSFSSRGPQVDLVAPGSNIQTTAHASNTAYTVGGGTSMSAPQVAGAAALLWSARPGLTAAQVRQALESTAQDVGPAGRDDGTGLGLVRVDRALALVAPSPPPSTFTASFTPVSGSNEWWVEAKVTASSPPAKVTASVDGGAPRALAKTSWGTWAASFHAPKGSKVVFTATDAAGATATSAPFSWLAPAAPAFTATFTPKTLTNHWWVEASVASSAAIAKVEVQLNGGVWTVLPKTSWGTYAKSLSVPAGTQLVFRATSGTGATALSPAFTEK